MLGLASVARWFVRPVDTAIWFASGVVGGAFAVPAMLFSLYNKGSRNTFSVLGLWGVCSSVPFGRSFFMFAAALTAPYSVSNDAVFESLTPDRATASARTHPWNLNPFASFHAVGLINLGEFVSGILMVSTFEQLRLTRTRNVRGIVTEIAAKYVKKARGKITASCNAIALPEAPGTHNVAAVSQLTDESGDVVAEVTCYWTLNVKEFSKKTD